MAYPHIDRRTVPDRLHGQVILDPYRRLEDPLDLDTANWQAAQNQLWQDHAAQLPGRAALLARVGELSRTGTITAPTWRGDRRFFLRQEPAQQHPVLHVAGPDGRSRALVDPLEFDPHGTVTLDSWEPGPDGRAVACQLSRRGSEQAELFVFDVDGGQIIDGPIDRCRYSPVAWLPGGDAFYYVRALPAAEPAPRKVFLHKVGTPASNDVAVLDSGSDPTVAFGLGISPDGRWLTVSASHGVEPGNDLWVADLQATSAAEPRLVPVLVGTPVRSVANVGPDGHMYVVTDLDCPHGRLCVVDPDTPQPEHWQELIRSGPEAAIADVAVLTGPRLQKPVCVVAWSRYGAGHLSAHDLATGALLHTIALPGRGSIGSLCTRPSGAEDVWFTYTDTVTPMSVYRYDACSDRVSVWERTPGAVEIPDVETCEFSCTSADGTPVRVVVVGRAADAGIPRPAILYGYGGFGIPLSPTYSSFSLAWVEAGGIFATAHVRGGGEGGEEWHRSGTGAGKQNSIDDFLAAAQLLIADGWTTASQLSACGESNGGLLVGAAVTQRPDLFAAAVCSAPLLDMVRYEKSGLGRTWVSEYGTAGDPDQLRWLLAYSPYHHVVSGVDYPAVLFTAFSNDTRVDPMHARKMCAALQDATSGSRPILLRTESDVGHGARAAKRAIALAADMLAFLAEQTGLHTVDHLAVSGERR